MPITDNVIVEELLGESGIICVEDIIDAFWKCKGNEATYTAVTGAIWPIQLAPLKETSDLANTTHEANGRVLRKTTTRVHKGGYLGNMGASINEFVAQLIWKILKTRITSLIKSLIKNALFLLIYIKLITNTLFKIKS